MRFWDMMASRYSCPAFLLDGYIRQGQLSRFICEAWNLSQEDSLWKFWLAKVNNGKSFNEFRESIVSKQSASSRISGQRKDGRPSDDEIRAIIESSRKVAEGYRFEERKQ